MENVSVGADKEKISQSTPY